MSNMQLVEKAWSINPYNFREPHKAPETVVYSPTPGQAKQKLLSEIRYDDFKDYVGNDISFLNLRIKRAKPADKYLIDGITKTLADIEYAEKVRAKNEAIDKLVSENPTAMAYIRKGGQYYRSNCQGYTEQLTNAGVYTIQRAAREVRGCSLLDRMQVVMINNEEHNKMINDKIEELKEKLIS